MDSASLPDLDSLDRRALVALLIAHHNELESQQTELASREAELAALAMELDSKKGSLHQTSKIVR